MTQFIYIPLPDWLVNLDRKLFYFFNVDIANGFFDTILPLFRNSFTWVPLYAFLAVFAVINYKKTGWLWILFFILTVSCSDAIGTYIFKHNFERIRPCNDPLMADYMRFVLGRCSGGFSFISNHAVNHFSVGTFFFITMRRQLPYSWIAFLWAGIIGFSQIYVGVHFPFDVLCGTLIGMLVGYGIGKLFNSWFRFPIFDTQTTALN